MANEITVQSSIRVLKIDSTTGIVLQQFQTQPGTFLMDMDGVGEGGPGGFEADTYGVDVDISDMDFAGMCEISNFDATNYVQFGIYDPQTLKFYPLIEIQPGQVQCFLLARDVLEEFAGTGTGTSAATNTLRIKANTAPCRVCVRVFER